MTNSSISIQCSLDADEMNTGPGSDSTILDMNSDVSEGRLEGSEFQADIPVANGAAPKRPLRLSNAHRRRVSEASLSNKTSQNITIKDNKDTRQTYTRGSTSNTVVSNPAYFYPFHPTDSTPSLFSCPCCKFSNTSDSDSHDSEYPEKCYEHQICLPRGGWKKHLEKFEHKKCPMVDCGKEFETEERFLRHWVRKHEEKCWYWGKKKGWLRSERVVWLKWDGN